MDFYYLDYSPYLFKAPTVVSNTLSYPAVNTQPGSAETGR